MKKKTPVIFLISIVLLLCLYFSLSAFLKYSNSYIKVYVASHNIAQRSMISKEDLVVMEVPKEFINDDVYTDRPQIIGKYVKLSYSIPKGSMFYKGYLEENIKDMSHKLLYDSQVSYDLYTSEVRINPGSLLTNMYVDLYLTITDKDKTVSDLLIENCRIIGLYDYDGKQIGDYDRNSRVNIVTLALERNDVNIINRSLKIGTLSVLASSNSYQNNLRSKLISDSEVIDYLQS